MKKFDLGCGYKKQEGYIRVDHDAAVLPDIVQDLNIFPWPIEDNIADEIKLTHVLEHLAPLPNDYKQLWQELYRICKNGAIINIEVPYWLHENFYHDPTHVRRITPITLAMMDQKRNEKDIMNGGMETTLGLQWKIDFELKNVAYGYDQLGQPVTCHYQVTAIKPARIKSS